MMTVVAIVIIVRVLLMGILNAGRLCQPCLFDLSEGITECYLLVQRNLKDLRTRLGYFWLLMGM